MLAMPLASNGLVPASADSTPSVDSALATREVSVEAAIARLHQQMSVLESRIFGAQELRHALAPRAEGTGNSQPTPVESALLSIDTLLAEISLALASVQAEVLALSASNPAQTSLREDLSDIDCRWRDLVADVGELREELKEDRWLGQFRTAANQATEMMTSLEKAMISIQDSINHVKLLQHRGIEAWRDPDAVPDVSLADFERSFRSFEARVESYRPSIEQVLSNLDRGSRERATRNGEALRRHADLLLRWRDLTDRMGRLEIDTNSVHLWLLARSPPKRASPLPISKGPDSRPHRVREPSSSTQTDDLSSSESSRQTSLSSRVKTPPVETKGRRSSVASSLSRSMSPFRGMLGKMSSFSLKGNRNAKDLSTGDASFVAASPSPQSSRFSNASAKPSAPSSYRPAREATSQPPPITTPLRPRWNSSVTKLEDSPLPEPRHIGRRSSSTMLSQSASDPSGGVAGRHMSPSASQPLLLASRGTTPTPPDRPPSRNLARPPTPSMIPRPQSRNATSPITNTRLPPRSASRNDLTPSRLPRPSSRNDHDNPRSSSSLSNYSNASFAGPTSPGRHTHRMSKSSSMSVLAGDDPSTSFLTRPSFPGNGRPQTPPSTFYRNQSITPEPGSPSGRGLAYPTRSRPSLPGSTSRGFLSASTSSLGLSPPSSFRHAPTGVPRSPSHGSLPIPVGSTVGIHPSSSSLSYKPNRFNLLDLEIARIINGGATTYFRSVERVDPLPRGQAAAAVDLNTAQYRFVSPRGDEKVYNCKALELHRGRHSSATGGDVKLVKVMIRVGGGWLDLEVHLAKLFAF